MHFFVKTRAGLPPFLKKGGAKKLPKEELLGFVLFCSQNSCLSFCFIAG
jgi:hypothetical protein